MASMARTLLPTATSATPPTPPSPPPPGLLPRPRLPPTAPLPLDSTIGRTPHDDDDDDDDDDDEDDVHDFVDDDVVSATTAASSATTAVVASRSGRIDISTCTKTRVVVGGGGGVDQCRLYDCDFDLQRRDHGELLELSLYGKCIGLRERVHWRDFGNSVCLWLVFVSAPTFRTRETRVGYRPLRGF